jgi:cytochrome oxidase assembly protein ShyY1
VPSYRFLLSRRWLILTLVAIALIPTMIRLGIWQLHRHEHMVAHNRLISDSLRAKPLPVRDLTGPGAAFPTDHTWRTVTATGRYDPAHQVVIRQRTASDAGTIGYYLVTPLVMAHGETVLVNRGWIPAGDDITHFPKVPATPSGTVTVTGRLRPDETTAGSGIRDKTGLPPRQVMLINGTEIGRAVHRTFVTGYIELTATTPRPPAHQPQLVPEPDHSSIGPHLAYAIQWWLFTAMVPVGWVVLLRRERRDLLEAAAKRENQAGPSGETEGESPAAPGLPDAPVPATTSGGPTGPVE